MIFVFSIPTISFKTPFKSHFKRLWYSNPLISLRIFLPLLRMVTIVVDCGSDRHHVHPPHILTKFYFLGSANFTCYETKVNIANLGKEYLNQVDISCIVYFQISTNITTCTIISNISYLFHKTLSGTNK